MFAYTKLMQAMVVAGTVSDTYFNRVTLLLNTSSTNGAQNKTFLDSSTANAGSGWSITTNGNATQGTFTPFSQTGWGNYFGGSADYFTMPDNASYVISGDFTVEAWIYPTSLGGTNGNVIVSQWPGTGTATNQSFQFLVNSTGKVSLVYGIGATNASVTGTSLSATLNTWNHVAVSRSGTTVRFFVNGSLDSTTGTVSGSFNDSTGVMTVGRINATDSGYFSGYISNCRLTIGGALYTSAFTPSTTPLSTTVSSGTVYLLTCQNNRFIDNSTLNATITTAGSPSVQAFSPFAPTAAYSTSAVGGSGYFDGTGDYLTIANNAAFNFGTGDFTVEFWFYAVSPAADSRFISNAAYNGSGIDISWESASNRISWYISSTAYTIPLPNKNAWNHVAFARTGTTFNTYINGARANTYPSVSANITSANQLAIGAYYNATNVTNAYITDVRLVKGQALYTGTTYTVPNAPLTTTGYGSTSQSITGTVSLLANFTNAGIYDAAAKNDLETVGNAQVSTTQAKFGTTSMYFDGTGDWLVSPRNWSINASENFTIEGWFYLGASPSALRMILSDYNSGTPNSSKYVSLDSTGLQVQFGATSGTQSSISYTFSSGQWYYIAITRSSNTVAIYVNGTSQTVTNATQSNAFLDQGSILYVGRWGGTTNYEWNGYIDELRITKGYARTITTPTAAFPTQ